MWGMFICEICKIKSSLFQPHKWTILVLVLVLERVLLSGPASHECGVYVGK